MIKMAINRLAFRSLLIPSSFSQAKRAGSVFGNSASFSISTKYQKSRPAKTPVTGEEATQIDVGRLDLRVGRILEAKKHPDADSLYVELVDLGDGLGEKTVISGLVKYVPIEKLSDRLVVCLCNIKPTKMRGIESQAMVLCASAAEKVEMLEVSPACKPGDLIASKSFLRKPDELLKKTVWEEIQKDLSVSASGECTYKGDVLRVVRAKCALTVPTLRNVPVK